ncbi:MAG: hypothetical protein ABI451_02030 [Dokdonella sp.]
MRKHTLHFLDLPIAALDLDQRPSVIIERDQHKLAVATYTDARLRRFDLAAANALPSGNVVAHILVNTDSIAVLGPLASVVVNVLWR